MKTKRAFDAELADAKQPQDDVEALHWREKVAGQLFGSDDQPVRIGRYTVLKSVGSGASGVVYAVYDPELDRRVAIKLLRPDVAPEREEARSRLQREAQALAKLSHPNVVSIHDVGTHDGQVFITMEFVKGSTVTSWATERRSWKEVVEVFVQAGRGLAAAHEAGLVHRDFKPDNVLIGMDGRVRVTDFGIARGSDAQLEAARSFAGREGVLDADADISLTPTGFAVGTPAYMAPEQYDGGDVDARSDQFSFCVALYEALFRVRPFAGTTLSALANAVHSGEIQPGPAEVRVPGWLRRVVLRGLRVEPGERYQSMQALLADLSRTPHTRRKRILATLAIVTGTGAAITASLPSRADPEVLCQRGAEKVADAWGPEHSHAIRDAFMATDVPYAEDSWARVERSLDRYSEGWVETHDQACADDAPNELVLQRLLCLEWRRQDLSSLGQVLAQADPDVVAHSSTAARGLTPPEECLGVDAVPQSDRMAELPERGAVDRVSAEIAKARALRDSGKLREGLQVAGEAAERAQDLGYRPLEAEALALVGSLQRLLAGVIEEGNAERTLYAALLAAEAAQRSQLAASVLIELAELNVSLARYQRAHRWSERAREVITRLGEQPELEGRLLYVEGIAADLADRNDEALAKLEQAVDVLQRVPGTSPQLGRVLNMLGELHFEQGRYDEALPHYQRALEIAVRSFGPRHIWAAAAYGNAGETLMAVGRYEEALHDFQAALTIRELAYGRTSFWVSHTLGHAADALHELGRHDAALAHYRRFIRIWDQLDGVDGRHAAWAHNGVAAIHLARGQLDEALVHARLTVGPAGTGDPDGARPSCSRDYKGAHRLIPLPCAEAELTSGRHLDQWGRIDMLGQVLLAMGREREAISQFEAALPHMERVYAGEGRLLGWPLAGLGEAHLIGGRPDDAVAPLEQSLAARLQDRATSAPDVAHTRFLLARALLESGRDRERALGMARRARDDSAPRARAEIDDWLSHYEPD